MDTFTYELKATIIVNQATGQTTVSVPAITMNNQFNLNLFLECTSFLLAHHQKLTGKTDLELLGYAQTYLQNQFPNYKKSYELSNGK